MSDNDKRQARGFDAFVKQRLHAHLATIKNADKLVRSAWPTLVGEELSTVTLPGSLEQGRLQVYVRDETWAREVSFRERRLLREIAQWLPDLVHSISCTVAPARFAAVKKVTPPCPVRIEQVTLSRREAEVIDSVEDDELRAVMDRLTRRARLRREAKQAAGGQ